LSTAVWPDHLLTLAEWDALPEDTSHRYELVEGILLVAPRPAPMHQRAMVRITAELDRQLPDDLTALADVDVLIEGGFPPTVRAPDVVVVPSAQAEQNPTRLEAADVLVAVEIISPGTGRTDRVTKLAEYADAGIAHYWLVDLEPPATLTTYLLVDGDYEEVARGIGAIDLGAPAPVRLDVDGLLSRR
jgi:Uma2 family endonuclease